MTPHSTRTAWRDDDVTAREQRIRSKILDGIEETLQELARPRVLSAAIDQEVRAQCAALLCRQALCRQALCRRAQRCRRQPCQVAASLQTG